MIATFQMKLVYMILAMAVFLKCGNGNVLRLDKSLGGVILSPDEDEEWNDVDSDDEKSFKAIENQQSLLLDQGSNLKLNDGRAYDIENIFNFHRRTYIHHFAVHGLCRHDDGMIRLYKALKSKLCHTRSLFIADLVYDLCRGKDHHLDNWVNELFDLNGDGYIDHFEKIFYDK